MQTRFTALVLLTATSIGAFAAEEFPKLAMFSGGALKGLWQMQILDSSQPNVQQMLAQAGNMSVCADIANQMAKSANRDDNCAFKVLSNTASAAEVETTCGENKSRIKMQKEDAQNFVSDITTTSASGSQHYKARYTYKGECKGDSVIQMDKNSPACQALAGVNMAAMCANAPEQYRAQCEQQAKQTQGMCQ